MSEQTRHRPDGGAPGDAAALAGALARAQRRALWIAGAALLAAAVGFALDPQQFYRSYLTNYLFWLALPLGGFGFVCLHNMTGGGWGFVIRRILETAAGTMPLMAVLFVPLLFGVQTLYPWARPEALAHDALLAHRAPYLNVPFFLARAALYFAIWLSVTRLVTRWSARQDEGAGPRVRLTRRLQLLSGAGLPIYALTVSFAAIDWGMTLEPEWFSTIYGMLFVAGQGLTTLAFAVIVLRSLRRFEPLAGVVRRSHFHDLGNLMLAFVMLWGYLSFSQYLIVWSGNLPEEIGWYLNRTRGGWQVFGPALIALHFALPFLLLLARRRKQSAAALARIAAWILVLRWVDMFWLITPSFFPGRFHLHWLDLVLGVGIGALWSFAFLRRLGSWPLLPRNDPRLAPLLESGEAHT